MYKYIYLFYKNFVRCNNKNLEALINRTKMTELYGRKDKVWKFNIFKLERSEIRTQICRMIQ